FFQAEDGIRDGHVTGVQTCALPISPCKKVSWRRSEIPAPGALGFFRGGLGFFRDLREAGSVLDRDVREDFAVERDTRGFEAVNQIGRASCRERVWVSVGGGD